MILSAIVIAHIGAVVSSARFAQPPAPTVTRTDGGVNVQPYTFATADASFEVAWEDGDNDPTGRFYFYYLDHAPTFQIQAEQISTIATAIPGPPSDGIWASCDCDADAGTACPDAGNGRDCRNSFTWDTSAIPSGTYWLIAVNVDPPYFVYNASEGPVRVAHGSAPLPPASIIVRPDGFGAHATSYQTQWLSVGVPPLTFDLSYGIDKKEEVLLPTTPLESALSLMPRADGSFAYAWNISTLPNDIYYLRVKVTDGNGASTFTDSHFGLTVFRLPDGGAQPSDLGDTDGGATMGNGCACDVTRSNAGAGWLLVLAMVVGVRRNRRRETGNRK